MSSPAILVDARHRFHDGAPVTAADAEFTLGTILDPANLGLASSIEAVLKEYRAVDDTTFVMVSNGPIASFLYDAALPILVMPKHVWAGVAPADRPSDPGSTGEDPARVVGSGPFRFVGRVQGDHVTLARNDDYWGRELSRVPYLDKLMFQAMPNSDTRTLALEVGDVDVARMQPTDIDRFVNGGEVEVVSYDALGYTCYACQLDPGKTPLFQDKAVRQALFVALDRQAIVDSLLEGLPAIARGTQPPPSPAYRPNEFEPYEYDPARARDLLAQAGWTDADGDGWVEKDGQRFSFAMLVRADSATRVSIATYLQDAWKDVGVEMTVEPRGLRDHRRADGHRGLRDGLVRAGLAASTPVRAGFSGPATTSSATAIRSSTGSKPSNGAPWIRRNGST